MYSVKVLVIKLYITFNQEFLNTASQTIKKILIISKAKKKKFCV